MNELKIEVRDLDGFFVDAGDMAERLDRGDVRESQGLLAFASMEELLKVITPNRWVLLRVLRANGPCSIRALSKRLGRDYRGVHADTSALIDAGLIGKGADGSIFVPWSRITAEMSVDIAA